MFHNIDYNTMKLFLAFLSLCFYKLNASYNEHLIETALNISQSSYCLSKMDTWECQTCSSSNIYETTLDQNSELIIFGYNNDYECMFVGFRGSSNLQNWISNIQISQIQPYDDQEIFVDKGFYHLYDNLKPSILEILSSLAIKYNTNQLLITGHSLGGALSTLLAFDLKYKNYDYDIQSVITFGSPRVGNDYFSKTFYSFQLYSKRITHYHDIVPHIPEEFLNYEHIYNEVWYNEENSNYKICDDELSEDKYCSNSCAPTKCTSTSDHLNYLNISMGNDGLC